MPGPISKAAYTPPYKFWFALMTQHGTAAPTANVYGNTLGGTIVWERSEAGIYYGTLVGAFTAGKTPPVKGFVDLNSLATFSLQPIGTDFIELTTILTDELLANTPIEIRVYN